VHVQQKPFDLIAFDADDTLWHNERSYRDARTRFRALLAGAGVELTDEELEAHVTRTEVCNLEYFGYGVSSFAMSLIETAIDLTAGHIAARDLRELVQLAKQMVSEDVELFDGAHDTVAALASTYPLMLVTKGDLLHQTSKLERSGLQSYFTFVEVVSHKTPDVYARILSRHSVEPNRFLMIGNSLRSDVLPVVDVGGWAVHVPAALTWSHEHADVPDAAKSRYFELPALSAVAQLVDAIARGAGLSVPSTTNKSRSPSSSTSTRSARRRRG
jgi:putative hydrolase of the HAD superfamily